MPLPLPALRRTTAIVVLVLLLLGALWWALWALAAAKYRGVIDGWIESGRAAGYEISYDDRVPFGFPYHVVIRFDNLHWKNTEGITFHAGTIDISALPWQWHDFNAKFKGRAEIDAPLDSEGRVLTIAGESGQAHVTLDKDGVWTKSRVELQGARLGRTPDFLLIAENLKASAERPLAPPKNHDEAGLTVAGEAGNVTLPAAMPSPFGPTMTKLKMNIRIMGAVPDFRRRDSVEAWNKESGVVEFDTLDMNWGPLVMSAKGTMGFDDDLQPEGAFVSVLADHDKVLKALMDNGFIAEREQAMLDSALSLFAKPAKAEDVKGLEVPIAVQLGGLFFGPVKIFSFPEIEWPGAAAQP
jgi:hypothetical protein